MRSAILVVYHNFEPVKEANNVVLAKCNCCSTPRFAVFAVNDGRRTFYYHGYDGEYARKLFYSLSRLKEGEEQ